MCRIQTSMPRIVLLHRSWSFTPDYIGEMDDRNSAEAHGSVSVSDIASLLLGRIEELTDEMTSAIQTAVTPYQQGLVDHETLRTASMMNLRAILVDLGRVNATASFESREN